MSQNTTNALQIPDSITGIKAPQLVMLFFLKHASIGYVAPDNSTFSPLEREGELCIIILRRKNGGLSPQNVTDEKGL